MEHMTTGVLIFEGMRIGVQDGDLTVSVDEHGEVNANLVLSTSYNILPIWLQIAYENAVAAKRANENISERWCEDNAVQKELLLAELTPSIQVFVACGAAFDALYDQLRPFAKISESDIAAWKKKRTRRSAQIVEVCRRVFALDNEITKAFKVNIRGIMEFRDQLLHPTHEIKQACTRPDIPVGVDWRFSAYRHHNASIAYRRTMEMLIHMYEKKAKDAGAQENMEVIFKALKEINLVHENA